ncbi:MAG: aminotransferase class I/II-fold pyridoxal phosphate-dependent enzyme [Bacteroidetes bacterium]|nr:aminotransferase class I/II-fold pyridoxal phosphate-dependent enzyme [Bacteroidota bacterium]
MDVSYIINELAEDRAAYFNAVAPPIIQTSNFAFNKVEDLSRAFEDEMSGYLYSRGINPTVDILRRKLAALDGAEDALVFNSGAAAIFAAVLANVKAGDHIVSVKNPYTWAWKMFDQVLPRFGVTTTYVDGTDANNFFTATRPETRLYYLESPNSWTYELQDLPVIADYAKAHQIVTIVDNSYCTPLYQQPIAMGIDISLQSATKFISGHSDVVAGVISGSAAMMKKIFDSEYLNIGSGIQPFNAWLLLRGLRTLPARLERVTQSTCLVVAALKKEAKVERLIFPLDPDFPQYALAKKMMKGAGGLLTIVYKANTREEIVQFCERLKHILMAVSWGGYESLVIPKCAGIPAKDFDPGQESHRMIRLYIGLEDPEYLLADLRQAMEA